MLFTHLASADYQYKEDKPTLSQNIKRIVMPVGFQTQADAR
jgi:hypothetical protein